MRRTDREIANRKEIEDILRRSTVCRLAMIDAGRPYLVPLCFGYDAGILYFHSAPVGKKIDLLKKNRNVCFEFDADTIVVPARKPIKPIYVRKFLELIDEVTHEKD